MITEELTKILGKNKYSQVVSILFNARTNAHIAHLQTRSFAKHKALNEFYDEVVDLADRFAESSIGTTGQMLTGFTIGKLCDCDIIDYLKMQLKEITTLRSQFSEGHLIQIIDDVVELYTSTIYKLTILN